MCKEKVAEPSCTSDSRRGVVNERQWINDSAQRRRVSRFTSADGVYSRSSTCTRQLTVSRLKLNTTTNVVTTRFFSVAPFGNVPFLKMHEMREGVYFSHPDKEVSTTCVDPSTDHRHSVHYSCLTGDFIRHRCWTVVRVPTENCL